jgi:hypothetical protein
MATTSPKAASYTSSTSPCLKTQSAITTRVPTTLGDETSPNFKAPLTVYPRLKGHHIFGRGKRACPGQDLAEAELLVFCGNLLKFFTLEPMLSEKREPIWPDPDRWTTDVIGGPLPFDCDIKIRDAAKLEIVERMYAEAFGSRD